MSLELLRMGPPVLAAGVGFGLGLLLSRISAPPPDAAEVSVPVAPAQASAPTITPTDPVPQGTANERIAAIFTVSGKQPGHVRDAALYRAILALGPEDFPTTFAQLPPQLSAYGKDTAGTEKATLLVEALLDRWITIDREAALSWLTTSQFLEEPVMKENRSAHPPLRMTALAVLARHAPHWAHDWVAALPATWEKGHGARLLLSEVSRRDTTLARRLLESIPSGQAHDNAIVGYVTGLAESDPRESLATAMAAQGPDRKLLLDLALKGAAVRGPAVAQDLLGQITDPAERFRTAGAALQALPRNDRADLLPWVKEETARVERLTSGSQDAWKWAGAAADRIPAVQRADAAAWAASLSNDPDRVMLTSLAALWAQRDPAGLRDWLTRSAATLDAAAVVALGKATDQTKITDPESARTLVEALPSGPVRERAMLGFALRSGQVAEAQARYTPLASSDVDGALATSVVSEMTKNDAKGAAAWVSQLADEPALEKASAALVSQWSQRDPAGAAAWVQALPAGAWRDSALASYARTVTTADPATAAEWAAQITDRNKRMSIESVVRWRWEQEDPAAARAYYQPRRSPPGTPSATPPPRQ